MKWWKEHKNDPITWRKYAIFSGIMMIIGIIISGISLIWTFKDYITFPWDKEKDDDPEDRRNEELNKLF